MGTSKRTTHPPAHGGGHSSDRSAVSRAPAAKPPSALLRVAPFLVFLVVFLAFSRCLGSGFVDWDDTDNFLRNPHYRGVGAEQIRWMFTTFHMGHFQPLTWLTLGLDYTWAKAVLGNGMDARAYHFTNVLLHATNAVLFTFVAIRLLAARTGQAASGPALVCAAAFAGLFFGAHPLRVESVAWITERRDLLSSFFFLGSVLFYLHWLRRARNRNPRAYALALGCFVLGLLSKVSVVVLPVVLLVIDAYPLGRARTEGWRRLLIEKAPFFVLSLVFGLIASFGQARHGWLSTLDQHPPAARLAQSFYGLAFYVWKTILPWGLLPIYEMHLPVNPLDPRFVGAAILVLLAAAGILAARRRLPGLAAAAAVYVVVLAPVLGIAQNGPQEVADRYSYISCMGWAIIAAGSILAIWTARPSLGKPLLFAGALVIAGLGALTWRQCGVWRSTESLWTYTAARAPQSSIAQNGYGYVLLEQGRAAEAIPILRHALAIQPSNEKAHHNLWRALKETGDEVALIAAYRDAIRVQPQLPDPYFNLGNALVRRNDLEGAIENYRTAVRLQPGSATHHGALAHALRRHGDFPEAEAECRRALALDPALALARYDLALALEAQGKRDNAIAELNTLLQQKPNNTDARRLLDQLTGNR